MKKKTLFAFVIGSLVTVGGYSLLNADDQETPKKSTATKEAKIRRLLDIMQAGDMSKQVMDRMVDTLSGMPNLPAGFVDEFKKTVDPQELVDLTVPIYDKHLTEEEVEGLLKFYSTPVGQKFASVQGDIMQEARAAGERWSRQKAMEVARKLKADQQKENQQDKKQD